MIQLEISRALIEGVIKAAKGRREDQVTTIITRPMWNAFCKEIGLPENSIPTEWIGKDTIRVYGSKTIVIESDKLAAISY